MGSFINDIGKSTKHFIIDQAPIFFYRNDFYFQKKMALTAKSHVVCHANDR